MKHIILICLSVVLLGAPTAFAEMSGLAPDSRSSTSIKSEEPTLSTDHKSIVMNGKTVLSNDDDEIFSFFKSTSDMCDRGNIMTTPTRKSFCADKSVFRNKARFTSIIVSPDKKTIGFTFETDELSPDKAVGIFYPLRRKGRIHFLTDYYLNNEFLGFSPGGLYFVYRSGCWEGACAFYIKDSETLQDKIDFIPPNADERGNYVFVRWLSGNRIEYKFDNEMKQTSLKN